MSTTSFRPVRRRCGIKNPEPMMNPVRARCHGPFTGNFGQLIPFIRTFM